MDCNKLLIVEDDELNGILLKALVHVVLPSAEIKIAPTLEDALPNVAWADLVITDYEFPSRGFLGLLPELQKERKPFILQTGGLDYLKKYDDNLQIDVIYKGYDNFTYLVQRAITTYFKRESN